ncbi:MAG TPA: cadherin domain-containing protein, partial [Alphaproteobacteria bacterium]
MARFSGDDLQSSGGNQPHQNITHLDAHSSEKMDVPSADFIAHADIARDGQDLVLTAPDGSVVIVDGYFSADPAPMIFAPDGTALTPELVQSFAHGAGALQYAEAAGGVSDVSPVGAVHEVHGEATVTHPDGTTEAIVPGTAIYQGDIVETEGDGAVEIGFVDESSFAVSANARLAIDEFVFDASSQGGESNFSMLRGMFVYTSGLIGREDPDDVKIGTPAGSIGIRGTVIAGNVDSGEITVVEGAIVLRDLNGNEVTLAGQFDTAKFAPGGDLVQLPTTSGTELAAKFVSINSVAPAFFSTIGNSGDAPESENTEPAQQEKSGSDDAPADAPAANPATSAGDQTQTETITNPLAMDGSTTGFDGTTDSFSGSTDTFAAAESESAVSTSAEAPASSFFTSPAASGGTSSQASASSSTTTTTPPPPSVTNAAPVIGNGGASYTMAENSAVSTAVGAITASDADGNALSYSIVAGNIGGAFSIDSAGMIHVAGTLDFETLATYTLTVRVSDGIESTDAQYTVGLTNANDAPTMAAATFTVAENAGTGTAVGSVTATDQDLNTLAFSETGNGTGAGLFQVDAAGNITVSTGATLNFEAQPTYTYEVRANDGNGGITTTMMNINLSDLNDIAPAVGNNAGLTANEGGAAVTLTAAMLSATDADAGTPPASLDFTVDSIPANGVLKLSGVTMSAAQT